MTDRLFKEPSVKNLALLLLGIAYGFSAKSTFLGFLAPFGVCLSAIALIYQSCYCHSYFNSVGFGLQVDTHQ